MEYGTHIFKTIIMEEEEMKSSVMKRIDRKLMASELARVGQIAEEDAADDSDSDGGADPDFGED
jgi:hypothetical protein